MKNIILIFMIVIIPHPTEQLKIANFQKEMSKEFNRFPFFPLWFPVDKNLDEEIINAIDIEDSNGKQKNLLKIFSNSIDGITININHKEQKIFFELKMIYMGKEYLSKLPFFAEEKIPTEEETKRIETEINSTELFPMKLKIFRIAKTVTLSKNSQGLQTFVWKKLSKDPRVKPEDDLSILFQN